MESVIQLNGWAIAVAVLAIIIIGFVWYGPLLGNAWMREMDLPQDFKPAAAQIKRSLLLMIVSAVFSTVALDIAIQVLRPSTWDAGDDVAAQRPEGACGEEDRGGLELARREFLRVAAEAEPGRTGWSRPWWLLTTMPSSVWP